MYPHLVDMSMWAHVTQIDEETVAFGVSHQFSDVEIRTENLQIEYEEFSEGDNVVIRRDGKTKIVTRNTLLDDVQASSDAITSYEEEIINLLESNDDTNEALTLAEYLTSSAFDISAVEQTPSIILGFSETKNTFKTRGGRQEHIGMGVLINYVRTYRDVKDTPPIPVENIIHSIIQSLENGNTDRSSIGKAITETAQAYSEKYPFRTDYDDGILTADDEYSTIINMGYAHREIDTQSIMGEIILKHPEKFPQTITAIVNAINDSPNGLKLAKFIVELESEHPEHAPETDFIGEQIETLKSDYMVDINELKQLIHTVDSSFNPETETLRSKKDIVENINKLRQVNPGETRIKLDNKQLPGHKTGLDEVFMRLDVLSDEYPTAVGAQLKGLLQYHAKTPQPISIATIIHNYARVNPTEASQHVRVLMDIIEKSVDSEYDAKSFKPACRALQQIADEEPETVIEHVEKLYHIGNTLDERNESIDNGTWPKARADPRNELENIILIVAEHDYDAVKQAIETEPTSPLFGQTNTQSESKSSNKKSGGGLFSSITDKFG